MTFNDSADSKQLSILATVVDDYCHQAGIAVGDQARERLGRQRLACRPLVPTKPHR
ncbi:hypothetical protein MESS2_p140006 [Mesorhizobium metallidurans STM 2683]|uniref:Uncharacterized protein n=1 Tax=Mesorhizobium metallidurans STM 2683 TaxID=1297569 RepID=M5EZ52_9HYPH|nr:hypothetical protein MESS2_p140006 [Mesorhizobium metallidurans STM 2683]